MYKRLTSLVVLSLGAMLCACDASFVDPNELGTPDPVDSVQLEKSKWYDTKASDYVLTGLVLPNKSRCNDTLPPGSHIIIGWELPNHLPKKQAYYFYGSGTVDPNKITKGFWKDNYNLSVTIGSLLPKQVMSYNADSSQVLAVGHLFLINTTSLKNGDTLLYSELFMSDILGGVSKSAVVYQKGFPLLLGKPIGDTVAQGFNLLRGYKGFGFDPEEMKATYESNPAFFFLEIDKDGFDTPRNNPMWLP